MEFAVTEFFALLISVVLVFVVPAVSPIALSGGVVLTIFIIGHLIAWLGLVIIDGDFDWNFF